MHRISAECVLFNRTCSHTNAVKQMVDASNEFVHGSAFEGSKSPPTLWEIGLADELEASIEVCALRWYGVCCALYGVWYMVYGIWYMAYGIWCMVWCVLCVLGCVLCAIMVVVMAHLLYKRTHSVYGMVCAVCLWCVLCVLWCVTCVVMVCDNKYVHV